MDQVINQLFLGGLEDVRDKKAMEEANITHVLSLTDSPLDTEIQTKYTCKFVRVLDMPEEDLLSTFDGCLQFIDEARQNGNILVHCLVGCSRGAAVVIAWLMKEKQLDVQTAQKMIKDCRPCINPNSGFHFQLELFLRMGYRIDPHNMEYKKFKLNMLALKMTEGGTADTFPTNLLAASPTESHTKTETLYKCKKCRQPLFREGSLLSHTIGDWEKSFDWRYKLSNFCKPDSEKSKVVCKESLFIEPVQWMADVVSNQSGKLTCPKCSSKVGSFIWYGEKCPCGSWVAPAFHIQNSKVDQCRPIILVTRSVLNNSVAKETVTVSNG